MATALVNKGVEVSTTVYPGTRHGMDYGATAWPRTVQFLQQQLPS